MSKLLAAKESLSSKPSSSCDHLEEGNVGQRILLAKRIHLCQGSRSCCCLTSLMHRLSVVPFAFAWRGESVQLGESTWGVPVVLVDGKVVELKE
jgi:hypothetical protein